MNHFKFFLSLSLTFGILAAAPVSVDARPPDPDLYSAIRTARKYINPKSHYAPSEIEECFTDTFNILAQSWDRLPVVIQREFQGIFLRRDSRAAPMVPSISQRSLTQPTLDSTTPPLVRMRRRLKTLIL